MARCSCCRQEKYPLHKVHGFLNCEDCIKGRHGKSWWRRLMGYFVDLFRHPFGSTHKAKASKNTVPARRNNIKPKPTAFIKVQGSQKI